MKIGLLYNTTDEPWGGINTFFRNFAHFLREGDSSLQLTDCRNADVVLSAGHYQGPGVLLGLHNLRNLTRGRNIHNPLGYLPCLGSKQIVFRLDGLRSYYAQGATEAERALFRNMSAATSAVFQSTFSKTCFDREHVTYPASHCIIPNGANAGIFSPAKSPPDLRPRIIIISNSWSTNARKGFETIARFSELAQVEVRHIGNWPDTVPTRSVKKLGLMQEAHVAEALRSAHFLLFPSENEACSNVVLEALATGLPVLYHLSGGTPEVCGQDRYGIPLPEDTENMENLRVILETAVDKYAVLRAQIFDRLSWFGFARCFDQYIKHFNEVLS